MNTRKLGNTMAVAATLTLGLLVEGKAQHEPEGTFTDVVWLGADINSPYNDARGLLSTDGLTLVFTSDRPEGIGDADADANIYIAERPNTGDPWDVRNLSELNTPSSEYATFLSGDALRLYYMQCQNQCDLYVATRAAPDEPFEAPRPVDGLNTAGFEGGLTLTAEEKEAYFISDRPGQLGGNDIWVATRSSIEEPFDSENVRNLKEVNTPYRDAGLSISADGLTLFLSDFPGEPPRPGGMGGSDIWCVSRASRDEPFGPAVNLQSPINTEEDDHHLHVSPRWPEDGALVFFSRCVDANCDMDIYQATWRVSTPPPPSFRRGDANGDRTVDLSDGVSILNHLFLGSPAPSCKDAADANDDGKVDLSDAIFDLNYLFLGSDAPPGPGPDSCGPDPTEDSLPECLYETTSC